MIQPREKEIDNMTVRVSPHRARAGARLLARLLKHAGNVLAEMRGLDLKNVADVEVAAFGPAISALFRSLTPDEFDSVSADILTHTTVIAPDDSGTNKVWDLSKPAHIDQVFTGSLMTLAKVLAFALEVNYGSFFAGSARADDSGGAPKGLAPSA